MVTNKFTNLAILTRPYNMLSGVLIFNIGFFLFSSNQKITLDYVVGTTAIMLMFAFATLQNDVEDVEIDKINSPDKHLVTGRLSVEEVSSFNNILVCLLLALSFFHFPSHFFPVLAMLLLVWMYNKKPFRLSYNPYLSIIILALMYGAAPLLYALWLNHGPLTKVVGAFVVAYFVLRFSISVLKDFKDSKGDRLNHKLTFYLRHGKFITAAFSLVLGLVSYIGIFYLALMFRYPSWLFILPIILVLINSFWRVQLFRTQDEKKLTIYFHRIFFGQNQIDFLLLSCFILLHK